MRHCTGSYKGTPAGYVKEWKINGEAVTIGVEKQIIKARFKKGIENV